MDKARILQRGTEAKFRLTIADVAMRDIDFRVELIYGYRRTTVEIPKDKMQTDDDGRYYFTFDTDGMVGLVTVRCVWQKPDSDYPDKHRQMTDEQRMVFIVDNPCPKFACCPKCDGDHLVQYEMINDAGIITYYYRLCDFYGNPLTTTEEDGTSMYLLVLKKAVEDGLTNAESDQQ